MIDQAQIGQEAAVYEQTSNGILAEIELMKFESEQDADFGAQVLREVKQNLEMIEKRRKEITVPLNAALNSANGLFRPARDALERCEKSLKEKLAGYQERKQLANRAAMELASKADAPQEAQMALALVDQSGPPKGVSVRHVWKFRIVKPELVPRQYCSPDAKKIGAFVNSPRFSSEELPGVEWFQEPIVSSRKA